MSAVNKTALRTATKFMYDLVDMRVRLGNRLKKKKDGSGQKIPDTQNWFMSDEDKAIFKGYMKQIDLQIKEVETYIKGELVKFPVYEYLKSVKGIGPRMSAVIISEFDIYKATTVSKMWQFCGLNPGMVRGVKVVKKKDGTFEEVLTDTMVRGDKLTPGFKAPFNKFLRAKMVGVLADEFLKLKSPYRFTVFDPYKERLTNSDKICKTTGKPWKESTKGHINNASRRHMIKEFIKDLYREWRTAEGLPVRPPYAEEFLGKVHDVGAIEKEEHGRVERAYRREKPGTAKRAKQKD